MEHQKHFARWREILAQRSEQSSGLILEKFSDDLSSEWLLGLNVWKPLSTDQVPESFDVVLINKLSLEMRGSDGRPILSSDGQQIQSRVQRAVFAVGRALKEGKLILCTTPGLFGELTRLNTTNVSVQTIDISAFLAGDELIYLLMSNCELSSANKEVDQSARYLTPIERSMRGILQSAGISFVTRPMVGSHAVNFVVDSKLVIDCGGWHPNLNRTVRDEYLKQTGYTTIRFSGLFIRTNSEKCLELIHRARQSIPNGETSISSTNIDARENEMSESQKKAVAHNLGPALVLAPPGSGKTRVIEERILSLVESGVMPQRIMCLSYTNAAVNEVKKRLDEKARKRNLLNLNLVSVSTINKFALQICRESKEFKDRKVLNKSKNPNQFTMKRIVDQALKTYLRNYEGDGRAIWGQRKFLAEEIDKFRTTLEPPDLRSDDLTFGEESIIEREIIFSDVYRLYESELSQRRLIDFNGQILSAIQILASDAELRLKFAKKFDYWLVDEFQDLAKPKTMLIRLLAAPERNLMVVGDDDQLIFGFAGARGELFEKYKRDWGDLTKYHLEINYRSSHQIIVRSNWLILRNKKREPKNILSYQTSLAENAFAIGSGEYWEDALAVIAREKESGTRYSEICLLFRNRFSAVVVEKLLSDNQIPHNKIVKRSFFNISTVKDLRSWMKVSAGIGTGKDWVKVLQWPNRGISNDLNLWLNRNYGILENEYRLLSFCRGEISIPKSIDLKFKERAIKGIEEVFILLEKSRREKLPWQQLQLLNLYETLKSEENALQSVPDKNINQRLDDGPVSAIHAYQAFEDTLKVCRTYREMEDWIVESDSDRDIAWDFEEVGSVDENIVRLSTIHGFKGRQSAVVCVLGSSDSMPDYRAITIEQLEEERRVAYVAVTRAQRFLFFSASAQYEAELSESLSGERWEDYLKS